MPFLDLAITWWYLCKKETKNGVCRGCRGGSHSINADARRVLAQVEASKREKCACVPTGYRDGSFTFPRLEQLRVPPTRDAISRYREFGTLQRYACRRNLRLATGSVEMIRLQREREKCQRLGRVSYYQLYPNARSYLDDSRAR